MTMTFTGAILGLMAAGGLLLAVMSLPPLRRLRLVERIAPFVPALAGRSSSPAARPHFGSGTIRSLTAPLVADLVRFLDRIVAGHESVRRRLTALGSPLTVEKFRMEQLAWGALGTAAGLITAVIAVLSGHRSPLMLLGVIIGATFAGILLRDWWLSRSLTQRNERVLAEFPVVAEMLALAVTAGEGPLPAIDRISAMVHGDIARQLQAIMSQTRAGAPLVTALNEARDATSLEPLARFYDGMAIAIERGTPMSEVLRAQAADVRALGKRQLLESGGKKEIAMMVPVVFLILPVTILFAFYPGLVAITTVAG